MIRYVKAEKDIMKKLQSPFIIKLHYAFQNEYKLFIVTEFFFLIDLNKLSKININRYAPCGSLENLLNKYKKINEL